MSLIPFEELDAKLEPAYERVEARRRELAASGRKGGLIVGGIIAAIALGILIYAGASVWAGLIVAAILLIICLFIGISSHQKEYSALYKSEIISEFVGALIENGEYLPEYGISESLFCDCGLFRSPDRYGSEDLIKGRMDRTAFMFSEVRAEERHVSTDSKGRTQEYWTDIFRGLIYVADFNKHFHGHTIVTRESLFGMRKNRVKLENSDFERKFNTYSTDQVEARYILTPHMMELILALDAKLKSGKIMLAFWDSYVIITITSYFNYFENSIYTNLLSGRNMLRNEYGLLVSLGQITEDLKLNTRIWTKE